MNKPPSAIKATDAATRVGSRYPAPYDEPCKARTKYLLGDVFGLDQFGVNLAVLEPGAWSSQRHWHEKEDEFIYVLSGELVLSDDAGDHVLKPGMCAGFKAGSGDAHHLVNRSARAVVYLEIGDRSAGDEVAYPDDDLAVRAGPDGKRRYERKDGTPW